MEDDVDESNEAFFSDLQSKGQRPSDKIDFPEFETDLEDFELSMILSDMPEKDGIYWIRNMSTHVLSIAKFDRNNLSCMIDHWGETFAARKWYLDPIERFLDNHEIVSEVVGPDLAKVEKMAENDMDSEFAGAF